MTPTLRVHPELLRSSGTTMAELGSDLAAMGAGRLVADLVGAVPGFHSGAVCEQVGAALDATRTRVGDELSRLGGNLQAAAEKYARTDEELGKKLDETMPPEVEDGEKEPGDPETREPAPPAPSGPTGPQPIDLDQVEYTGAGSWPGGEDATRGYIDQALDSLGITDPGARENWMKGYLRLVGNESAYNSPNYQVNTDPNDWNVQHSTHDLADGYGDLYSRGAAQCIPPTFAQFHQPGTSNNIYDPVANIAASMNYVMGSKGVLPDGSNLAAKVHQADPNHAPEGY